MSIIQEALKKAEDFRQGKKKAEFAAEPAKARKKHDASPGAAPTRDWAPLTRSV